ncbi:hypothetical protein MVLG_05661 [Microbotryum lychnidis-dioicae p1A1 Lamole]|uniref:Ubiquitin-like domain-containing protein n=1 Tax=Microbotryum lychnidis-dioicae (strain p1A1 Lamole / MvSl-1064) TaxID=683840 RepID=U5HEX2_USTV1|nr:hypothetical protein MVLG_05661 [Microbotryum lychnidis-dioicae p1A1 Lamole]|eukprot:KDE03907.1 hypothetical protein MVLG_05661 [Microbotryum lychnidis-dioicae p1A1 Lamole]
MLNKLVWRMQSAIQRDPKTGEVEVPVRFGIIESTHFAILAESVINPNNDQEAGLVYTPIFKTSNDVKDRDRYAFDFRPKSIPLLFLAIILDYLVKVPPPPDDILNSLFGTGKHRDDSSGGSGVEGQTKLERSEEGDGEQPSGLENKRQRTARCPSEAEHHFVVFSTSTGSTTRTGSFGGKRKQLDVVVRIWPTRRRWLAPARSLARGSFHLRTSKAPPEAHYPCGSGGSRSLFSFKLAHLLDPLWWRTQAHHLSSSTSSARSDVLDVLSSQLAQFNSLLRASDNVLANKAIQLLDHPTTTQTLQLISTYSPYWFPAFLIVLTSLYSRRSSRLSEQRRIERHISARLQARVYAITDKMFDLGLGTPSAEGMPSGSGSGKGWGEVEVQWGKEKIRVPLPPPNSPLSTLKAALFNITGVAPDHQKLIYSGAILKDDLAPLSSFGLIDNPQPISSSHSTTPSSTRSFWDTWSLLGPSSSQRKLKKLVLLGSKEVSSQIDDRLMNRADLLPTGAEEIVPLKSILTEEEVIEKVDQVAQNKLKSLIPDLEKVERWIANVQGETGKPQMETETKGETEIGMEKPNPRTLIFLSEALLQALLKLDSIEVQSGYDRARAARKQGVMDLQAALDRVDALKPRFKNALAKE